MIDVKELRIGNIVKANKYGNGIVVAILNSGNNLDVMIKFSETENTPFALKDIEPIKLTKDILEKCGFQNGEMEHGCLRFHWRGNVMEYGVYDEDNDTYVAIDNNTKKNLHQLQNLYFALTGEELDVKL